MVFAAWLAIFLLYILLLKFGIEKSVSCNHVNFSHDNAFQLQTQIQWHYTVGHGWGIFLRQIGISCKAETFLHIRCCAKHGSMLVEFNHTLLVIGKCTGAHFHQKSLSLDDVVRMGPIHTNMTNYIFPLSFSYFFSEVLTLYLHCTDWHNVAL